MNSEEEKAVERSSDSTNELGPNLGHSHSLEELDREMSDC